MTKAKEPKNMFQCEPKIWKGFTTHEKNWFNALYHTFVQEVSFPLAWSSKSHVKDREIVAHNMAVDVIYEFRLRNRLMGDTSPYEMLLRFGAMITKYTPKMKREFNRLAKALFDEYKVRTKE